MLSFTIIVILLVMLVALARAFTGPNVFDRVLAANLFGTKTVLLIAAISYLLGSPDYLDIAVIYALINYISVIGVLRVTEIRRERRQAGAE
ncbi:monovalent cation/H+ antiporter complex subunit F [Parahaliea mediterranea]|uniref:PH regulation protein F n=1 Tax=Parahaliea mediterranea TaxID=651086 RepID=A0A939IM69_9GAMM|nr:monovalent cation/H+ antiporter complex subunit F [Parahaliea mediterranea]MBN7797220.1 pH regulation protein F [Parahaliea mediterranea]